MIVLALLLWAASVAAFSYARERSHRAETARLEGYLSGERARVERLLLQVQAQAPKAEVLLPDADLSGPPPDGYWTDDTGLVREPYWNDDRVTSGG